MKESYRVSNGINCNVCGRFIKYDDIASGKAIHTLITPDSHVSREEWDSVCAKCKKKKDANSKRRKAS